MVAKCEGERVSAFMTKLSFALRVPRAVSETDLGIIEAMIEIGADDKEISEQFGYSLPVIEKVRINQNTSPYRVLAS